MAAALSAAELRLGGSSPSNKLYEALPAPYDVTGYGLDVGGTAREMKTQFHRFFCEAGEP